MGSLPPLTHGAKAYKCDGRATRTNRNMHEESEAQARNGAKGRRNDCIARRWFPQPPPSLASQSLPQHGEKLPLAKSCFGWARPHANLRPKETNQFGRLLCQEEWVRLPLCSQSFCVASRFYVVSTLSPGLLAIAKRQHSKRTDLGVGSCYPSGPELHHPLPHLLLLRGRVAQCPEDVGDLVAVQHQPLASIRKQRQLSTKTL